MKYGTGLSCVQCIFIACSCIFTTETFSWTIISIRVIINSIDNLWRKHVVWRVDLSAARQDIKLIIYRSPSLVKLSSHMKLTSIKQQCFFLAVCDWQETTRVLVRDADPSSVCQRAPIRLAVLARVTAAKYWETTSASVRTLPMLMDFSLMRRWLLSFITTQEQHVQNIQQHKTYKHED